MWNNNLKFNINRFRLPKNKVLEIQIGQLRFHSPWSELFPWECMTSWISCVLPCFYRPDLTWPNSYNRFSVLSHDIQLHCIINAPNNERSNGSIRQCLTTGPHATLQWKSSGAKLFLALPTTESQKGVSRWLRSCDFMDFVNQILWFWI